MFKKISLILIVGMFILGISKSSFAMDCGGMSGQHSNKGQAEASDTGKQVANNQTAEKAVNVGNKICPVSGEKIDEKTKATYEYKGKIYNFCCSMCLDEFKKDPEKYIKKIEEEKESGSAEKEETETMEHEHSQHSK